MKKDSEANATKSKKRIKMFIWYLSIIPLTWLVRFIIDLIIILN